MPNLTDTIDNFTNSVESGQDTASFVGKSLRRAINAHCKACIYDEYAKGDGTWRQQTEACTVTKCSLYEVRPISKPRKLKDLPLKD